MVKIVRAMLLSSLLAVPATASLVVEEATEEIAGESENVATSEDAKGADSDEDDEDDGEYDDDDDEDDEDVKSDEDDGEDGDADEEESEYDEDEDENEDNEEYDDDESPGGLEATSDFMKRLDKNKDGKLSKDEIFPYAAEPEGMMAKGAMPKEEIEKLDHMAGKFDENLSQFDKDGDKLINREELPSLLEWMQKEDDKYGFQSLDENKDGKLDFEEIFKIPKRDMQGDVLEKLIAHFHKTLKSVDKDGDQLISLEEFPALMASADAFWGEQQKEDDEKRGVKKPGKKQNVVLGEEDEEEDEDDAEEEAKNEKHDVKKPGKKQSVVLEEDDADEDDGKIEEEAEKQDHKKPGKKQNDKKDDKK